VIIIRNSMHCNLCNTEVESKHRHDFVSCKCGNVSTDGGQDYVKRSFRPDAPIGSWHDTGIYEVEDGDLQDL
jgi:hypothetical protein